MVFQLQLCLPKYCSMPLHTVLKALAGRNLQGLFCLHFANLPALDPPSLQRGKMSLAGFNSAVKTL
ncbi:hypothetical protein SAMN02745130_02714 [Thiothrix eikelboomii]|uniref:Uncharacterized protein n=1 Tax=Thiothrix eikelboomii TaxID=92487 RepID=A0A1T4XBA7_9GAMM|nr:hypothetical protein SAMN02745130_02714 [Thiothrix eikelboomii]